MPPPPPEFGPEFLAWLKDATERAWSRVETDGPSGVSWRRGTRWTGGLSAGAIGRIESQFGVRFGPQQRLFLQTLHSTRPCRHGIRYEGGVPVEFDTPGFYDWIADERELRTALERPVAGLADAPYWHADWGPRPAHPTERRTRLATLAPPLLPLLGHRYAVDGTDAVLSVQGGDVVVYGYDLRDYLLRELQDVLGMEVPERSGPPPQLPFWGHVIAWD